MSEFSLIDLLHKHIRIQRDDVVLGSGDDCALLQPPVSQRLAVSTDTLIAGRHFPLDTPAHAVGYKSLAVNLSDLAAMGATPAWVSLALSLPKEKANEKWLTEFAEGFSELAERYQVQLTGGDTTQGPLSITVTVIGFVPMDRALERSGAQVGDDIYISGVLGAAGRELLDEGQAEKRVELNYPKPRVELGQTLLNSATSCIDVSDGLLADLGHVLSASKAGAQLWLQSIPVHQSVKDSDLSDKDKQALVLTAGDEYELCFTAPESTRGTIEKSAEILGVSLSRIGQIQAEKGLRIYNYDGQLYDLNQLNHQGYNHFEA